MRRIDHILFQADPDFIGYFEALPLPASDYGNDPASCFADFICIQLVRSKSVDQALEQIEVVMREGGWNAEQLVERFFPQLRRSIRKDDLTRIDSLLGPSSRVAWTRLIQQPPITVI